MGWFAKGKVDPSEKRPLGRGVFRKCDGCGETRTADEFTSNLEVCPGCGYHYRISAEGWIDLLLDPGSWEEHDTDLVANDPLEFKDTKRYRDRVEETVRKTGMSDGAVVGSGRMHGRSVQLGALVFRFMAGSMGSVVGEKITRVFERGLERREPVILLSSSGGARMQEGILSLMQMAKTTAAQRRLRDAGVPFISVLLHPTTGGVAASFALTGDVNIAEPRALIGFAGPRVIEQTIRQKLPEGFQSAEFLLEKGMVDLIAERREMRATIGRILYHLTG
ncbi:MAG: acetyl-CoA carboxylase, carboxyltransferase subunit beta [Myxococcota bacterium]